MNAQELIEAVSKMSPGKWHTNGSYEAMAGSRKVAKAMAMGSGGNEYVDPARDANIDGIVALKNHAIPIIESLLQRVAELEKDAGLLSAIEEYNLSVVRFEPKLWSVAWEDGPRVYTGSTLRFALETAIRLNAPEPSDTRTDNDLMDEIDAAIDSAAGGGG